MAKLLWARREAGRRREVASVRRRSDSLNSESAGRNAGGKKDRVTPSEEQLRRQPPRNHAGRRRKPRVTRRNGGIIAGVNWVGGRHVGRADGPFRPALLQDFSHYESETSVADDGDLHAL